MAEEVTARNARREARTAALAASLATDVIDGEPEGLVAALALGAVVLAAAAVRRLFGSGKARGSLRKRRRTSVRR